MRKGAEKPHLRGGPRQWGCPQKGVRQLFFNAQKKAEKKNRGGGRSPRLFFFHAFWKFQRTTTLLKNFSKSKKGTLLIV